MIDSIAQNIQHHLAWVQCWREQLMFQSDPETARFPGGPPTPEEIAEFNGFVHCLRSIIGRLPTHLLHISRQMGIDITGVDMLKKMEVI